MIPLSTNPLLSKLSAQTRAEFVRRGVEENALTAQIIDAIFAYFPPECFCIAGYVSYTAQYWPVNDHWDALLQKIDHFLAQKSVPEAQRQGGRGIRAQLMSNSPDPLSGYRNDLTPGMTKDRSSPERIEARFTQLRRAKLDFETLLLKSGLIDATKKANPSPEARAWWSVLGPIPAPKGSKHATGFALDIAGPSTEIIRIGTGLGATVAFAESGHTHVEWGEGVKLPH